MKDTILEDLKAYEAPSKLPPIATAAYALYEEAGFRLNDPDIDMLRRGLQRFEDDLKALTDAIVGLGAFALFVRDHRNDNETAEKVARLIGEFSPKYEPIGRRIVSALEDLTIKATDLLDQFTGKKPDEKRRAPTFGESGPAGSIPLKSLKPVGAPPPLRDFKKKPK